MFNLIKYIQKCKAKKPEKILYQNTTFKNNYDPCCWDKYRTKPKTMSQRE